MNLASVIPKTDHFEDAFHPLHLIAHWAGGPIFLWKTSRLRLAWDLCSRWHFWVDILTDSLCYPQLVAPHFLLPGVVLRVGLGYCCIPLLWFLLQGLLLSISWICFASLQYSLFLHAFLALCSPTAKARPGWLGPCRCQQISLLVRSITGAQAA